MLALPRSNQRPLSFEHDAGALAPVLEWIDPKFGPIMRVQGVKGTSPDLPWWIYDCKLSRPWGEHFVDFDQFAMGCSISGSDALIRALGEAVERYNCVNSLVCDRTRFAPLRDNPLAELFPVCAEFEACLESLKKLPLDTNITQVPMTRLCDGEEIWVPAGFVHLNFSPGNREPMVINSITSGLAFHTDRTKAIWSGLLEYAERDAIMSMWWSRIPAPRIELDANVKDTGLKERLRLLRLANMEPFLFDVTSTFRIPTVFCVLRGERQPYVTVGGSCHSDPATACSKALDEAAMIQYTQSHAGSNRELPSTSNFDWVKTLADRGELYAKWKQSPALEFLLNGKASISFEDFDSRDYWRTPKDMVELQQFARVMANHGMTALWSDTSVDEVRELGYCVKTVVPEMTPLTASNNACFLGTPRLAKAAGKEFLTKSDVNPFPHPFT